MAIRLPAAAGRLPEDMLIEDNDRTDAYAKQHVAIRGPTDQTDPAVATMIYTNQQLQPATWAALQRLRLAWCQEPPDASLPPPASSSYEIALACPSYRIVSIHLDSAMLPEALRQLLVEVPSPQQH